MAFTPIDPTTLIAGMVGNDGAWETLATNSDDLYSDYRPPVFVSQFYATTPSSSYVVIAEWHIYGNADLQTIATDFRFKSDSGTSTVLFQVIDDASTYSATAESTGSASWSWRRATVTPGTMSDQPAICRLSLKAGAGAGAQGYVSAVRCELEPAAPAAGVLVSGYARTDATWYAAGAPVSSERVRRLCENMPALAADRPATIVSVLDDWTANHSRAFMTTDSSATVCRFMIPEADQSYRDYQVSMYLDADGSAVPVAYVYAGQYQLQFTDTGWHTETITLAPTGDLIGSVLLGVGLGSGNVFVRSFQVTRA